MQKMINSIKWIEYQSVVLNELFFDLIVFSAAENQVNHSYHN